MNTDNETNGVISPSDDFSEKITDENAKTEKSETDLKENFAKNLTKLRKIYRLTQAELAEKLNYSDKAVSKWERAESIPDVYALKMIADFFGVKVDTLISEPRPDRLKPAKNLGKKRIILSLASTAIVWLVAVLSYFFIHIISPSVTYPWLSFIYGVPVNCIVLLVFTSVWGKSLGNLIIISALIWSILTCVYVTLLLTLPVPPAALWEIFLIGAPAEGVTLFWFLYVKVK
ncbi:MAG: helix-turn-helix transcriptional regulator [Clostridia bacterium]|nr:helix-turn-helix transcriptional regulator [Clostridia bacterium]